MLLLLLHSAVPHDAAEQPYKACMHLPPGQRLENPAQTACCWVSLLAPNLHHRAKTMISVVSTFNISSKAAELTSQLDHTKVFIYPNPFCIIKVITSYGYMSPS